MRNDRTNPEPSPEQLAAFLDGELDSTARSRVAAWLAGDPAAAAEIDGQRRLARLWADNPPPEPGPGPWAATLARVAARLPAPATWPRRLPRTLWLGAGVAAAALAALLLTRFFSGGAAKLNVDKIDPLPVIGPGDVVVISMDARDAGGLVVAAPPVQQPILLASQDDVSVLSMEAYPMDDGQVPQIGEGDVPLIVAPHTAHSGGREP